MDQVHKESLVVSDTRLHWGTAAGLSSRRPTSSGTDTKMEGQKDNYPHLHQKSKAKNDVQISKSRGESPVIRIRIPGRFGARCEYTSCNFWHPTRVQLVTKLNQDAYMAKSAYSAHTVMLRRHPARRRGKRVLNDQLLY